MKTAKLSELETDEEHREQRDVVRRKYGELEGESLAKTVELQKKLEIQLEVDAGKFR